MSADQMSLLLMLAACYLVAALLGIFILQSYNRRSQEVALRRVLVQFGDYMLAHLMRPEEVTTIDSNHPASSTEDFQEYMTISLETARLSARQNLTNEDLQKVVAQGREAASRLKARLNL